MTKKSLIKTLLGVSVLAIGAGSFAVANAKPAANVRLVLEPRQRARLVLLLAI
jgi:hypothetical protein